ncbi:MAG: ATP-dependent Clp protease proteolytic subunit [Lachnospiraceae bacterium]|nr:ATP-dependent Clp protease proteolytic subunit [Lachnospiraceae bacterium]
MRENREEWYQKWEAQTRSRLLVYITGDRKNAEAQITEDVIPLLAGHLEKMGDIPDLSLFLYTRGGSTSAAWTIIHLLRMYTKKLRVIVPYKAQSAGTIICLGADEIWMTRQAVLGPIDPSVNTALNPRLPDGSSTFPVSVEQVHGFLDFAREELHIQNETALKDLYAGLSEYVHPLVLGQVYHSNRQIPRMADSLLSGKIPDPGVRNRTVSFLCGEAGSHDYTIARREAEDLGLPIVCPPPEIYGLITEIYEDIRQELLLDVAFGQEEYGSGSYLVKKCLLESLVGGTDEYVMEGDSSFAFGDNGSSALVNNTILFEGWRHREW